MEKLRFRPEGEFRAAAERAFAKHARGIRDLLPEANVEHIGATAVRGSLTKGDLDLLVRVPEAAFSNAVEALRSRYVIHQPENWTRTFASFKEERPAEIPVGIQVVTKGSADDSSFVSLRELFRERPDLVQRYNELKRNHEDGDPEVYVQRKAEFLEGLLTELREHR